MRVVMKKITWVTRAGGDVKKTENGVINRNYMGEVVGNGRPETSSFKT